MAIGRMRQRLELQSASRSTDGGGGAALTWSKVANIFCDIQTESASESMHGRENEMREVVRHKILMRYRPDVSHKNRLVQTYIRYDGEQATRIFNIKGVVNMENRFKFLELTCEEGVPT